MSKNHIIQRKTFSVTLTMLLLISVFVTLFSTLPNKVNADVDTLGYMSIGGYAEGRGWNSIDGYIIITGAEESITLKGLHWYGSGDGNVNATLCVYSVNEGVPTNNLLNATISVTTSTQWYNTSTLDFALESSTSYFFGIHHGGLSITFYYTNGSTNQFVYKNEGYSQVPSVFPTPTGYEDWQMSLYADIEYESDSTVTFPSIYNVTATSMNILDVQAAVDNVEANGTLLADGNREGIVMLPEGVDGVWSSDDRLNLTQGVSIYGDSDGTLINQTSEGSVSMIYVDGFSGDGIPTTQQMGRVEIKNLWLNGSFSSDNINDDDLSSTGLTLICAKDFYVHNCTFTNFAIGVYVHSNTGGTRDYTNRGVIANCTFDNPYKTTILNDTISTQWAYGVVIGGTSQNGVDASTFGGSNAFSNYGGHENNLVGGYDRGGGIVYIEDCAFNRTRHAIDVAASSVGFFVARYNIIHLNEWYEPIKCHPGGYGFEAYNNTVYLNSDNIYSDIAAFLGIGGYMIIYNNTVVGGTTLTSVAYKFNNDAVTTPVTPLNDTYIWSNTLIDVDNETSNLSPSNIREGIEYNFSAKTGYIAYPYPFPFVSGSHLPPAWDSINYTVSSTQVTLKTYWKPMLNPYSNLTNTLDSYTVQWLLNDNVTTQNETSTSFSGGSAQWENLTLTPPENAVAVRMIANNSQGQEAAYPFQFFTLSESGEDSYTADLTRNDPQNTTYTSSTVPVDLSASTNGTNPVTTWNIKFANGSWLYGSNQTYTVATSVTINENLTATFCAHLSIDEGETDYKEVVFTVYLTEAPPSVTVTINQPTATTYETSQILVSFTASGGTINTKWFNVKNGSSWIYATNQTYTTPQFITGYTNGTYTFYAFANNTYAVEAYATVTFTVAIPSTAPAVTNPTLTIVSPFNRTYITGTFKVELSWTGTADAVWYNIKNGSTWVYTYNLTYTASTNLNSFVNGTYTFYAFAANSLGGYDEATTIFSIGIIANPVLPQVNVDAYWLFLWEGDFLGFIQSYLVTTFLNLETAIVLIVMLFMVPLYLRTKSLLLLSILWLLLGFLFVAVLPAASGLALLFVGLGIGGLLWRLFRPAGYG